MTASKIPAIDWVLYFQWLMATTLGWVLGRFLFPNLAFLVIGIALGVLQWVILRDRIRDPRGWLIATILGWTLGAVILMAALPPGMDFLAGVIIGTTLGIAQWLVLRREVGWSGWWIMINIVAWTTGLAFLPGIILSGVVAGGITGLALVLLLREPNIAPPPEGELSQGNN